VKGLGREDLLLLLLLLLVLLLQLPISYEFGVKVKAFFNRAGVYISKSKEYVDRSLFGVVERQTGGATAHQARSFCISLHLTTVASDQPAFGQRKITV